MTRRSPHVFLAFALPFAVATVMFGVALLPCSAHAQDDAERKVHVLEQKPFLHALRVEVVPLVGYTISDVLYQHFQVGGQLRFHILDELAISGTYGHYFSDTSGAFDDVQSDFSVFPEKKFIRWFAGGDIAYTPIYGKFVLFGSWIVHWNAYIALGAGVTQTGADDLHITGTGGIGTRFFLTDWLTFNMELKNHIYRENFKAGDKFVNNVVLHAGFGVFIPFGFDYEFTR